MFQIARNAGMDHFKARQPESALPVDVYDELPGPAPLPGRRLEQAQQETLLQRALLQLPPDKREVLVLSRYEEMKYDEIAGVMGCEVGTVKVRVHRALKELREVFLKLSSERLPCPAKKSEANLQIM
jgi:RNA polymerase sigma-70 factor (ECF subfamily)